MKKIEVRFTRSPGDETLVGQLAEHQTQIGR